MGAGQGGVIQKLRFKILDGRKETSGLHPFVPNPKITTGAGDHFNSGFCLGKLLGFSNPECVLTGVSTSGFYVKNAISPSVSNLANFLNNWPS